MVSRYKTMISILKIWLQCNYRFLSNITYLFHQMPGILTLPHKVLQDGCEKLFRAIFIIFELIGGRFEFLGVFVQAEVGKVHIQVLYVCVIWFFVVVGTESCKAFVVKVSFNGVDTADEDVKSQVKFLFV